MFFFFVQVAYYSYVKEYKLSSLEDKASNVVNMLCTVPEVTVIFTVHPSVCHYHICQMLFPLSPQCSQPATIWLDWLWEKMCPLFFKLHKLFLSSLELSLRRTSVLNDSGKSTLAKVIIVCRVLK